MLAGQTYRTFLGLMTKHQRVQMRPVQVRAMFWVRESFSAGRYKSEMPAMTIDHCKSLAAIHSIGSSGCCQKSPSVWFELRLVDSVP